MGAAGVSRGERTAGLILLTLPADCGGDGDHRCEWAEKTNLPTLTLADQFVND
jgi:hypothetical protein